MRRFFKILSAAIGLLILVIAGGIMYLAWMGGIETVANDRIAALFAERNNLDIHIGHIGGSLFSGFTLDDVDIFYIDGDRRYLMADIPHLTAVYSFSNLWNRRYVLDHLHIDSISLTFRQDSTGHWLLPPLTRAGNKPPAPPPYFSLHDLGIDRGTLTVLRTSDTSHFDDISVAASIEGDQGTYSVDLNRLAFNSDLRDIELDAATGKITYSEHRALFQDIALSSQGMNVRADGNIVFGDTIVGTVQYAADNVDVEKVGHFVDTKLSGKVDVSGNLSFVGGALQGRTTVAGDFLLLNFDNLLVAYRLKNKQLTIDSLYGSILGGCTVDGNGGIDFAASPNTYYLDADLKNFNLLHLLPSTFPSDLTGHVKLDGESFTNATLVLDVDADLYGSSFDEYPIQDAAGHLTITTDSLIFADSFRVDYYENTFWASGKIDYSHDIDLALQIDLPNLDRYRNGKIFIDQPGGRGYAEATLTGQTSDPDLRGWFASDSCWIYGLFADTLYATVNLDRFLSGRQGTVDVRFAKGAAWNIPYDTGYVDLTIDSNLVYVDSSHIFNPYSSLTGHASLDYMVEPQQLRIGDLAVTLFGQRFANQSPLLIDVDTAGFIFNRAAIGNADALLSLVGRINYDESMDFLLAVEKLPIAPWLHLFDSTIVLDGYVSAEASVNGTFRSPEFNLMGGIDSLSYKGLDLGDLTARLAYAGDVLSLDTVRVMSNPGEYVAAGSLYVDLAFTTDSITRFPQKPMSVKIHATDSRFDLVSLIMPSVEQLDGDFWADFELFGTPHDPHLEGEAYIKNARLKYFDLENPIYADSAGVTMHDNSINIRKIEVFATDNREPSGRRHYAEIEGDIKLLSLDSLYYALNVTLENEFPFVYELDDIRGKVEGELSVDGPTPPLVTGDLTLISAQYRVPFVEDATSSPIMTALSTENPWDLNINVEIPSNYWIKNEDIDAEFAGSINLIREKGNYRFVGEMQVLRGRGFLFDKTFRLDPTSTVTFEGNDTLNPRLDITGYTRVSTIRSSAAQSEGPVSEQVDLCIHVGGTLLVPDPQPCPGSDFSQADILPLILANTYSGEGVAVGGQIEDRLFGLGYNQMSQIGARQLERIGVETFEIDPVYGGQLDPWNAWVTLGSYFGPFYVYGRSTLAGQTRQEAGFEYRYSKTLLFEGSRDENELYHLNLRLHWEF